MPERRREGEESKLDIFEVFVEASDGIFSASIPCLSLMESGRDLSAISLRIIERARMATDTLGELNLYTPAVQNLLFRQESPIALAPPEPALAITSRQIKRACINAAVTLVATAISLVCFFALDYGYSKLSPRSIAAQGCESRGIPHYDHGFQAQPNCSSGWTWREQPYTIHTDSAALRSGQAEEALLVSYRDHIMTMGDSFVVCCWTYPDTAPTKPQPKLDSKTDETINAGDASKSATSYYLPIRDLSAAGVRYLVLLFDIPDIDDEASSHAVGDASVPRNPRGGTITQALDTNYMALPQGVLNKLANANWLFENFHMTWMAVNFLNLLHVTPREEIQEIEPGTWAYEANLRAGKRVYGSSGIEGGYKQPENRARQIAAALKKYNIGLMIGVYPWPQQLKSDKVDPRQVQIHRKLAATLGAKFLNLFPAFVHLMEKDVEWRKYYREGDVHFSPLGNDLVADKIRACYEDAAACEN